MYALRRTATLSSSLSTISARPASVVFGALGSGTSWNTAPAPVRTPPLSVRTLLTFAGAPWSSGVQALPATSQLSPLCNNRYTIQSTILNVVPLLTTSSSALMKPSSWMDTVQEWLQQGLYWISTLKRRRKMMNKHKLRKRRKKNRMKNK